MAVPVRFLFRNAGEELLPAIRTNAVRQRGSGILRDVSFDLLPITAVIANLLAPRAERQQAIQNINLAGQLPRATQRGQRIRAFAEQQ